MTSTDEMRAVLEHAAEKLANGVERSGMSTDRIRGLELAAAYAHGVLDLLVTYLEVTDEPKTPAAAPDRSDRNRAPDGRFLPTSSGAPS